MDANMTFEEYKDQISEAVTTNSGLCPVCAALSVFNGKWKLSIIRPRLEGRAVGEDNLASEAGRQLVQRHEPLLGGGPRAMHLVRDDCT